MKKKKQKDYDLEFMHDYFGNDGTSMRRILRMYIHETPQELAKIEEALKEKKINSAKQVTHQIKLNIRMLGVPDTDSFFDWMQQKNPSESITKKDLEAFRIFYRQTMETISVLKSRFFSGEKNNGRQKLVSRKNATRKKKNRSRR